MDSKSSGILVSLIKFLALTGGRQKVCRLIQYFCKFLSTRYQEKYQFLIHQRNSISISKNKVDALGGAAGMTRKVLRFGPSITLSINLIKGLKELVNNQSKDPFEIAVLKLLSFLFIGIFFVCDHYAWLFKMGLVSNENLRAKMEFWSAFGWFLDCITGLVRNFLLYKSNKSISDQKGLIIDTIKYCCDFIIAYSFVKPGTVNGKTVGLLGTSTSLIGIYQMWK